MKKMKIYRHEEINYSPDKFGVIESIHIFLKHGYRPMATLTFCFGGVVTIPWDRIDIKDKYKEGINAYTIIYDDRAKKAPFINRIRYIYD